MKRTSAPLDHVPQCALNPQDIPNSGHPQPRSKSDSLGKNFSRFPANRGSGSNLHNVQRQIKQEPQYPVSQEWPSAYDNSNTSWENDWIGTPSTSFPKHNSTSGGYYKQRNPPLSYQSSSNDWSTGESSTSSSAPSGYAAMQTSQQSAPNSLSASSSSYYENNNFYGGSYNYDSNLSGYGHPSYRGTHSTQQYQQPVRSCDAVSGSYNGNRNPSSCPPTQVKQPVPDYNQRNSRYGMDHTFNKVQIKKEPEDYTETEGENFTSLFTKSLTSLYSEDPDNAYREDGKPFDPDIIVCSPPPTIPSLDEQHSNYQRLGAPSSHYNSNSTNYQNPRNSGFGFYEGRSQPTEPMPNVVEIGSENERANLFRYDRPSFDDMHLYASPNDSKSQAKKRKMSTPNIAPEGNFGAENRRKAPRMSSFKSDSQWTPNSFIFSDIQIKKEPEDDYPSPEKEPQSIKAQIKDNSLNSNGNCISKSPSQQIDHPKPVPRKRSPAATCFDRFEKKSTPTNKKVSPLSVYAKVQESIVLNVKCRRYKKRTKPIVTKEEVVYPGREEIENWKRTGAYSQTPDHAVRILMGEVLERVSQVDGNNVANGPDLTQMDPLRVRELLFQFCQRYSIDFRDFEDINSILKPRIIIDEVAKNSERASAIRKRTSKSPAKQEPKVVLESKSPKVERVSKKASNEDLKKPAARRVLRSLPGREHLPDAEKEIRPTRRQSNKTPTVRRRYSTRSAKDVDGNSDVDIIIDSSTDRESEAGKEAEVRKKSERLKIKNKQPVLETPAKDKVSDQTVSSTTDSKREAPRTRSIEKRKEVKEVIATSPKKKWSRLHNSSTGFLRSSSIELVDITKSDSSSTSDLFKDTEEAEVLPTKKTVKRSRTSRNSSASSRGTPKRNPKQDPSPVSTRKSQLKPQDKKCNIQNNKQFQDESYWNTKKETKLMKENVKIDTTKDLIPKQKTAKFLKDVNKKACTDNNIPKQRQGRQLIKDENKNIGSSKKTNESCNIPKEKRNLRALRGRENKNEILSDTDISKPKRNLSVDKSSESSNIKQESNLKLKNLPISKSCNKNTDILSPSGLCSKFKNDTEIVIKKENDAIETEKLSALQRNNKSTAKTVKKSSNKRSYHIQTKDEHSTDSSSLFKVKIKEEPLSPNESFSRPKKFDFPLKKEGKIVQIAVNKPNVIEHVKKGPEGENNTQGGNRNVRSKAAKSSSQLLTKKEQQRRNSQHSDSEPQVVLMKLPDVHINSAMGSIPLEYFERYVSKEINRSFVPEDTKSKSSEDNSSVGSPPELVCMKDLNREQDNDGLSDTERASKIDSDPKADSPDPLPLIHYGATVKPEEKELLKKKVEPQPVMQLRYSVDSEDSECGLIIDLDRRMSTEEETPCPHLNDSKPDEEGTKPVNLENILMPSPDLPKSEAITETTVGSNITTDCVENESNVTPKEVQDSSVDLQSNDNSDMGNSSCSNLTSKTVSGESTSSETSNSEQTSKGQQNGVESILRSLLLERTADGSTGPSQPSTSSAQPKNSKTNIPESVRKFLLNHANQSSFMADSEARDIQSLSEDVRSTYEDMKVALDQLPDINLLSDNEDWIYDSKLFKDKLERLKHEIMYLQCVAYQKEKERIGMICLKRYMEEVMKRLVRRYQIEQVKYERQMGGESTFSHFSELSATAETSAFQSQALLCRHLLQMANIALSIAKKDVTSAMTASEGEQLPAVETMVANAVENYGIDLRIVKSCGTTTHQTILQQVLSSKEPVYNQLAPSSSTDVRSSDDISSPKKSIEKFQKIIPSSKESPFKPFRSSSSSEPSRTEEPLHQNILLKALSKKISNSPSSSQSSPPLPLQEAGSESTSSLSSPSSSTQEDYPLDFSVVKKSLSSTSSDIPAVSSKYFVEKPKNNAKSSPKHHSSTTYSIWRKTQATRNTSSATTLDLRIDHVKAQEAITLTETTSVNLSSNSPPSSSSQNLVMMPSSISHSNSLPLQISSKSHQQHSERAHRLFPSSNHISLSSELVASTSHQRRSESAHTVARSYDQAYSRNGEEERRPLSYSSLVTSSNSFSYGEHARSIAPSFTIIRPPETTRKPLCFGCGISEAKFICSGCREHWYCSEVCQNLRWPEHREACAESMYRSKSGSSYIQSPAKSDH